MTGSALWSDATALAGPLHDLLGVEVTTAIGRCTACGRTAAMAEVRVFDHAPGLVARCPGVRPGPAAAGPRPRPRLAGPTRPDLPATSHGREDLSRPA